MMANGARFTSSRCGDAVRLSGVAVMLFASWAHAQVGATVPSSLDQTAAITSKGKMAPSNLTGALSHSLKTFHDSCWLPDSGLRCLCSMPRR